MPRKVLDELIRRFGFPDDLFRDWETVDHDTDVFITTPEVASFTRVKPVRKGIRLARTFPHGVKPTTNAVQLLGRHATRNVIELDAAQAQAFIQGETVQSAECGMRNAESSHRFRRLRQLPICGNLCNLRLSSGECGMRSVEPGFVIVRHAGFTLGVGLYKPGSLKSQIPLSRRTHG